MYKQHLKFLIFGIILFMLGGCGEKFDASTESMIKISYNGILADLDHQEKEIFVRQYDAYTQQYFDPYGGPEGEGAYEQKDIESLHGMSYGEVIDAVAEHEHLVTELSKAVDLINLTNLHVSAISSMKNIYAMHDSFDLELGKMGNKGFSMGGLDAFGYGTAVVKITNNSNVTIENADVCITVVRVSNKEEVLSNCYEVNTPVIPPGHVGMGMIEDRDLWSTIGDKRGETTMYIAAAYDENGNELFPYMSDAYFNQYNALKATYKEEFKDIVAQYGPVPE